MLIEKDDFNNYIFDSKEPKSCKTYKLLLHVLKKDHLFYISPDFLRFLFQDEILGTRFLGLLWDIPDNFGEMGINEKIELFKEQFSELDLSDYFSELELDISQFSSILKNFIDISPSGVVEPISSFSPEHILKSDSELDFKEINLKNLENDGCNFIDDNKVLLTSKIFSLYNINPLFKRASVVITPLSKESKNFFTSSTAHSQNIKPLFLKDMHDLHSLFATLEKDLAIHKRDRKMKTTFIESVVIDNLHGIENFKITKLAEQKEIYIVGDSGEGKSLFLKAVLSTLKGTNFDGFSSPNIIVSDSSDETYQFGEPKTFHKNILAYGLGRGSLNVQKDDICGYMTLFDDSYSLRDPKGWLRTIKYLQDNNKSTDFTQTKEFIENILDIDIEVVDFETLPSMKRYLLHFTTDFISRLSENQPIVTHISELQGIVFVDEVEFRLNASQKALFIKRLRTWLPNVQFFFTTFSKEIVLNSSKDARFYRLIEEDGKLSISKPFKHSRALEENLFGKEEKGLKGVTKLF
jgi:hypothetical protein